MSSIDDLAKSETSHSTEDNRLALIVGVNNSSISPPYRSGLQFAEKDADDMAYLLKQPACNFTLLTSLTGEKAIADNIKKRIVELSMNRTERDFLLFYYAGHAVPINDDIYFVTHDFQEENIEVAPDLYLSMHWLWKVLYQSSKAGKILLVLDCCYAGNMIETNEDPLKIDLRKLLDEWDGSAAANPSQNRLRLILSATGYNYQAREINGHGLMTGLILQALQGEVKDVFDKDGYVDIKLLHGYLQERMPKEQWPELAGKFGPYTCLLASHPHRSEHFRNKEKEAEIKNNVEKGILGELFKIHAETQHTQPFDHSVCYAASLSDLDWKEVTEFLKQERVQQDEVYQPGASDQEQLLNFGFLENTFPTYGALLCFGKTPMKWVSGAITRFIEWGNNSHPDHIKDSREFKGSLLRQRELSLSFLRKCLRLYRVIGPEGSKEEWEVPFRAIEEAVANALVHREYANRTDPVRIEVFDNRIEISSPGKLPLPMTEELLREKHKSFPRNPQIAGIFYLLNYIEKLGAGIDRMRRYMEEAHLPEPEFKLGIDDTFTVALFRPKSIPEITISTNTSEENLLKAVQVPTLIWNIPYRRNPFFTGREQLLTILHDNLTTKKVAALTQPQAISGLGGVGKTQIAIEYAYRYRDEYQAILWVNASTQDTLITSFLELTNLLDLPEKDEQDQSIPIRAVKHWLEQYQDWLIIYDNADNLSLIEEYLPRSDKGHILLTTREQAPGMLAQALEVEKLDFQEGVTFLLRRAGLLKKEAMQEQVAARERTAAKVIVKEMDGLPLALDQAGAYIEETGCRVGAYLANYQRRSMTLLQQRRGKGKDHPDPVATTWSLSFEKVEQQSVIAADLLRVCAFFAPDAIPEEIFRKSASELGPHIAALEDDEILLHEALGVLRRYSLVKLNAEEQTISVHRLVQHVLKEGMEEDAKKHWAECVVRAMNRVFPDVKFNTWEQCEQLLPHALVCAVLIEENELSFVEAARLLNQSADYLNIHGRYSQAEPLYQRALAIREKVLGSTHPDTAQSLNNLALLYESQGKYSRAELLLRRALEIREQVLGSTHPDTAQSLNNLALLYESQGKYSRAELLLRRALEIREQVLGSTHPDTATSLNNLASLYYNQGKYSRAELLLRRALEIREQVLGSTHPDTATSLNNLASLYYNQGKYSRAEPLYQRALAIKEQMLGSTHPDTAQSLNNLALLYKSQDKYSQAEALLQRALEIREQALGSTHPSTAVSLANLADIYSRQGKYSQAEALLQRALAISEQMPSSSHHTK